MKDRGQSEPWAQQAYLCESVSNKHVTKEIKEVLKSYDLSTDFKNLRTLLYKMATTYVDRFNEGTYVTKVTGWSWPRDHLNYATMRRSFEKLMDSLQHANGDGHALVGHVNEGFDVFVSKVGDKCRPDPRHRARVGSPLAGRGRW